ncbi:MAG: hypothetical protein IKB73_01220 [Ruminococcus sp.]|nr:hypothetical protein [Ruminococcus sp.]
MLKKIIEMDEQARLVKEKAQKEKADAEKEIIETKERIYNDYINRAKERVEKNLEVDKQNAEKAWKDAKTKHDATLSALQTTADKMHDQWVKEIVDRTLNA